MMAHLTLVAAPVPPADIADDEIPVPGPGLVSRLQPQVRGVGVAAHRQQRHVRHADPAHLRNKAKCFELRWNNTVW